MTFSDRNKQIVRLRKDGFTLKEIGRMYSISPERVRQVLNFKPCQYYCKKHKKRYRRSCNFCTLQESFYKKYDNLLVLALTDNQALLDEINEMKKADRSPEQVLKRRLLVKKLRDEFKMSFLQMGKLFDRHHTTIMNLYYKK